MVEVKTELKVDVKAAPKVEGAKPAAPAKEEFKRGQGFKAEVVEVLGRTGTRGEIHQVMCRIIDGKDRGRVIRRNIKGKVKKGDFLLLLETERESKAIRPK